MSKAEDRALEAYPKETRDVDGMVIDIGYPQYMRDIYIYKRISSGRKRSSTNKRTS